MSQARVARLIRRKKSLPLNLTQNSQLNIQSKTPVNVLLSPEWRDDAQITLEQIKYDENRYADWTVDIKEGSKAGLSQIDVKLDLVSDNEKSTSHLGESIHEESIETNLDEHEPVTITAQLPEMCNVNCFLQKGGDITVSKKLEGLHGFDFKTTGGNIYVNKLRGDAITLDTKFEGENGGSIFVSKACEAQELNISIGQGGRLRAKMLNVSNATVQVEDAGLEMEKMDDDDGGALVDISSIYASQTGEGVHVEVGKSQEALMNEAADSLQKVRVKSSHGHISVRTVSSFKSSDASLEDGHGQKAAYVDLGGINGSFDVSVEKLGDGTSNVNECPDAARVHIDSLSPGQANILTSDYGNISLTLDRKIESDVRLLSSPFLNNTDPNMLLEEDENELLESLIEHDDDLEDLLSSNDDNRSEYIEVSTPAFSGRRAHDMKYVEYVQGVVENKSHEPNSRFDVKTKGVAPSAGKIRFEDAQRQALQGFTGGKSDDEDQDSGEFLKDLPLLAVATDGRIKVETLSWFGAIARRYGIDKTDRDLGRQATAGAVANSKRDQ